MKNFNSRQRLADHTGTAVKQGSRPRSGGLCADLSDSGVSARYLGSKVRVTSPILDLIGAPRPGSTFVDAFAGTGAVAREAAIRGWPVRVNDHLFSSSRLALASVLSRGSVPFSSFGGYERAISTLNAAPPVNGFIYREYTPASSELVGIERRYFTVENGAKIDGVRQRISTLADEGHLTKLESSLLLADLLVAATRVANTAGTFGCFMKRWQQNAVADILLTPRTLLAKGESVEVCNVDVSEVPTTPSDVAYFDPPYTKRQYAAYYHVLETIALGDSPSVQGVTGLRPWRNKASDFCYRRRALTAIVRTMRDSASSQSFLSYSSEGHVALDDLVAALSKLGDLEVHSLGQIGRYAPNENAREKGTQVTEYLLELKKTPPYSKGSE